MQAVGHDNGLGHGQGAGGAELLGGGALHEAVLIAELDGRGRPVAGGDVGKLVVVGCRLLEVCHALAGSHGGNAQAERQRERQDEGQEFFHRRSILSRSLGGRLRGQVPRRPLGLLYHGRKVGASHVFSGARRAPGGPYAPGLRGWQTWKRQTSAWRTSRRNRRPGSSPPPP